jgi:hypothetical protein
MKTIITLALKETRQHGKWALAMALMLVAGLAYGHFYMFSSSYSDPVLGRTFALIVYMGIPLIAIAVGLLASLPDSKGDAWAFLVHRPIAPAWLFLGKLLGALLLYSIAVLLPYALYILYISSPNHLGTPFVWSIALPGLAACLNAAVFLAAAMAVGFSPARWYASRTLPLGIGVISAFYVANAFEFSSAALVSLGSFAFASLAACHAFVSTVPSSSSPIASRLGSLTHAASLLAGLLLAVSTLTQILPLFLSKPSYTGQTGQQYILDTQGRLLVLTSNHLHYTLKTPEGQSVAQWDGSVTPELYNKYISQNNSYLYNQHFSNSYSLADATPYTMSSRYFFEVRGITSHNWYYNFSTRNIQGYSPRTREYLGSFGPNGFSRPIDPPQPPFSGQFINILENQAQKAVFSNAIYPLHLDQFLFSPATFQSDPGESILCAGNGTYDPLKGFTAYFVITSRRLLAFRASDNQQTLQVDMPPALYATPLLSAKLDIIGNRLFLTPAHANSHDFNRPNLLIEIDIPSAQIVSVHTPAKLPDDSDTLRPLPPQVAALAFACPGALLHSALASNPQYPDRQAQLIPWIASSIIISFLAAFAFTFRRKSPPLPMVAWTLFCALLGVPGLLLMAILTPQNHIPVPPPAPNGTEVFAPL